MARPAPKRINRPSATISFLFLILCLQTGGMSCRNSVVLSANLLRKDTSPPEQPGEADLKESASQSRGNTPYNSFLKLIARESLAGRLTWCELRRRRKHWNAGRIRLLQFFSIGNFKRKSLALTVSQFFRLDQPFKATVALSRLVPFIYFEI